jgi:hypothetical protein
MTSAPSTGSSRQPGVLGVVETEHRHRRTRSCRPRLPHDTERLATLDGVGEVGDGLDEAVVGRELDRQVLDDEGTGPPSWAGAAMSSGRSEMSVLIRLFS